MSYKKKTNIDFQREIISPEIIDVNRYYTITINPNDDNQSWQIIDLDARIKSMCLKMRHVLFSIPATMWLKLEISSKGRMHWHGTILWSHVSAIASTWGGHMRALLNHNSVEIDSIYKDKLEIEGDEEAYKSSLIDWKEYCNKSKHLLDVTVETTDATKKRINDLPQELIQYKHTF